MIVKARRKKSAAYRYIEDICRLIEPENGAVACGICLLAKACHGEEIMRREMSAAREKNIGEYHQRRSKALPALTRFCRRCANAPRAPLRAASRSGRHMQ
jgi:hypothetical protein